VAALLSVPANASPDSRGRAVHAHELPGRVDVIIPTFNRAHRVGNAIRSVLAQSAAECCEIYIVDDGSSDNTAEVVARFGQRVNYVRQEQAGPAAARNAGIRASSGEFVTFLDSDDVWLPDKIERQLAAMRQWPEVLLVGGRSYDQASGARHLRPAPPVATDVPVDFASPLFDDNFLPTPVVMVRRSALLQTGMFAPELPQAEDYHLWTRLACRGRGVFLSAPVAVITTDDPGSLTRDRPALLHASLRARRLLRSELVKRPDCRASWRRGMAACLAQLRDGCYRRGEFAAAAGYGAASLIYRPWPRARWEFGRVLAAAGRAAWGLTTSAAQ
jgi:glycosyltransferase involved in cell wall biosynthesis